ncbi:hypothetical protein [Cytobacillus horneckiae]|uniref:hypothetical protein n=1 Tax=Cytobacillus horneckiae TaxID=549687 RepID=UPI002DBEC0DD|nr:hypothetical protein [Cytobacillus horneckiae]MEC1157839.1 hypothetical protein [Cytobacillus horneckiae]MED2940733.1 hypothetical protein [Cytobacillus horneckiae]
MKIQAVATYVWNNAIEIQFGKRSLWDGNTFRSNWYIENYPYLWEVGGASDLYWFLVKNISINDLKNINTPETLPVKATKIAETVNVNVSVSRRR